MPGVFKAVIEPAGMILVHLTLVSYSYKRLYSHCWYLHRWLSHLHWRRLHRLQLHLHTPQHILPHPTHLGHGKCASLHHRNHLALQPAQAPTALVRLRRRPAREASAARWRARHPLDEQPVPADDCGDAESALWHGAVLCRLLVEVCAA